eukprot:TRINITY_DN52506_c0_g1_i1.p1 TRINITY_DN52506_c0_g1~~TRINITY_DN52506_c0_g1_i1.p1  ORF type:complete len:375 (-),score=20.28 TRINITY_DN52506_c0_g1_i1:196-1320(-)
MATYTTYCRYVVSGGFISSLYYYLLLAVLLLILVQTVLARDFLFLDRNLRGNVFARLQQPKGVELICPPEVVAQNKRCEVWDWLESVESNAKRIFITTYVQEKLQGRRKSQCDRKTHQSCKTVWQDLNSTEFYISSPERFNIVLEHRVRSTVMGHVYAIDDGQVPGVLMPPNVVPSEVWDNTPEASVQFGNGSRDFVTIDKLLASAGVNLQYYDSRYGEGLEWSLRKWGVELDLTIHYTNIQLDPWKPATWFKPSTPQYAYTVKHVPVDTGVRLIHTYKQTASCCEFHGDQSDISETRVIRRRYGIQVTFAQSGVVGWVTVGAAIGSLVTILTMLGIPWTLAELYLSAMPNLKSPLPAWYGDVVQQSETPQKMD